MNNQTYAKQMDQLSAPSTAQSAYELSDPHYHGGDQEYGGPVPQQTEYAQEANYAPIYRPIDDGEAFDTPSPVSGQL